MSDARGITMDEITRVVSTTERSPLLEVRYKMKTSRRINELETRVANLEAQLQMHKEQKLDVV